MKIQNSFVPNRTVFSIAGVLLASGALVLAGCGEEKPKEDAAASAPTTPSTYSTPAAYGTPAAGAAGAGTGSAPAASGQSESRR